MKELRKDYIKGSLLEEEVEGDPYNLFARWFEDAKNAGVEEPNAFCLSTVNQNSRPSSRILLLKEIEEEGYIFYTNYGSRKGQDLDRNPFGSMLFYWTDLERQVRIEGKVIKLPGSRSDEYFASRPRGAQVSAALSKQSKAVEDREALLEKWKIINQESGVILRPKTWGGYKLIPDYYEFWQGREDRLHDRLSFQLKLDNWELRRLYP